jgi:chorismate synthase
MAYEQASAFLDQKRAEEDSAGGIVECIVAKMPTGVGEPVFEKLDAALAKAIFSIGAVKGLEFGSGFSATTKTGSENNDSYQYIDGDVTKLSNNAGGIVGGISDGSDIVMRIAFKTTPSIHKTQHTITNTNENIDINIKGRHDPIVVPRAVVVVEAMTAVTLVDYILQSMLSRMDIIKKAFL